VGKTTRHTFNICLSSHQIQSLEYGGTCRRSPVEGAKKSAYSTFVQEDPTLTVNLSSNLVLSRLAFSLSLVFFILSTITSHLGQLLYLRRSPSRFGS